MTGKTAGIGLACITLLVACTAADDDANGTGGAAGMAGSGGSTAGTGGGCGTQWQAYSKCIDDAGA